MPFRQVKVTTEPTQICPYDPKRSTITIRNVAGSACYISDSQVDILSKGFPLAVGEVLSLVKKDGDQPEYALWGQTSTGEADIRVIEQYGGEV